MPRPRRRTLISDELAAASAAASLIAHAGSSPVAAATFHDAGHADVPGAGIASSIRFDSLRPAGRWLWRDLI